MTHFWIEPQVLASSWFTFIFFEKISRLEVRQISTQINCYNTKGMTIKLFIYRSTITFNSDKLLQYKRYDNKAVKLQINHHFRANNSVFVEMEHPRFGTIMSASTRDQYYKTEFAIKLRLEFDAWFDFVTLHYQFEVILMLFINQMQIWTGLNSLSSLIMNQDLAVICVTAYSVL